MLNQVLIDSVMLYQLYKKHHWQVLGPTFYQLHLLFDKHAEEQSALIDLVAERVQMLGGVAAGMPHDVAERTLIPRPPAGAEAPSAMLSRLVDAHELLIVELHASIELTERNKDWGTNDLLVSDVLRTNEKQVWFLTSHLVELPLARVPWIESGGSPEQLAREAGAQPDIVGLTVVRGSEERTVYSRPSSAGFGLSGPMVQRLVE
jgi:starvation-inducible DNA-binding protein